MKAQSWARSLFVGLGVLLFGLPRALPAATSAVVSWNNLGMHCMDSDYSVFSILPPYNTIEAQVIVNGRLVTNGAGYTVTYEAVRDPALSFNSTARGKGNFYDFSLPLYGTNLPVDAGLKGWAMPGTNNVPQPLHFEQTNDAAPGATPLVNWWRAEGIPIAPYDDAGRKNPYPLMRLIVSDASSQPLATNDTVLPVSDEMDCRLCHASGSSPAAQPAEGWVWSANPERDYRLNILRRHDRHRFTTRGTNDYSLMLATNGFNLQGLYRSVVADAKPVLCAKCHLSEALPGTGVAGVPPLTAAVHGFHATVTDPILNTNLDSASLREACYRCHPGSATRCLRGAMGKAVAADGTMAMQCQSCHGTMSQVGAASRVGWFQEPKCQSCHTGTAAFNNGQIRYTTCFEPGGAVREAVNQTFATVSNTPAPGLSLYRFSAGHGGLQCSACHGSTHAEFPTSHTNDNIRNLTMQGHAGMNSQCTACHTNAPDTVNGGPHGLHPVGSVWIGRHDDTGGGLQCQACHGANSRGTVLSRSQTDQTFATSFGSKTYWRGRQVGCYDCHNGPGSESASLNTPPAVGSFVTNTTSGQPVTNSLPGNGINGNALTFRVVSQPLHGTVALTNATSIYFPEPGFVGPDAFTFTAFDGTSEGNLATGAVSVAQGPFGVTARSFVPATYPLNWAVPLGVVAAPVNVVATPQFLWDFGDGAPAATNQFTSHAYTNTGIFHWTVIAMVPSGLSQASVTNTGQITIQAPEPLQITRGPGAFILSWPNYGGDALLYSSPLLGLGAPWTVDTNWVTQGSSRTAVQEANPGANRFFRLKQL
jgi:hypothetical protein